MSTTTDYDLFVQEYAEACEAEARADADKRRKEEFLKIAFSEMVKQQDCSAAKAEHLARASTYYVEKAEELSSAILAANLARAKVKAMDLRFEMFRSRNANRRQEMGMMGRV